MKGFSLMTLLVLPSGNTAFVGVSPFGCRVSSSSSCSSRRTLSPLEGHHNDHDDGWGPKHNVAKSLMAAVMAGVVWSSPLDIPFHNNHNDDHYFSVTAYAKEKASGTGSRVNKDAASLLRYGLPIDKNSANSKDVRKLQVTIEDIKLDIGSKRKAAALDGVKKTATRLNNNKLPTSCREPSTCSNLVDQMKDDLGPLELSLKESLDAFQGSQQERTALDKAYASQERLASKLSTLVEQMVPAGYSMPVPKEYNDLPQLVGGRATVEMTLAKPDQSPFDVNGVNYPTAKMVMVIDGFNSPVTGGNFVDLVSKGFYDNMKIQRSDGFVVQTGDPDGPAEGYTGGTASKAVGAGPNGERLIPLEITIVGDPEPLYETTIEDEGRGGEATVLPFSSYGAMGWARDEYDPNSGSSQFFWLLFDSDLTPAGKNVLDGRYPCFGYVVEGADFLSAVKEGDIITSAKVTSGLNLLKQPIAS